MKRLTLAALLAASAAFPAFANDPTDGLPLPKEAKVGADVQKDEAKKDDMQPFDPPESFPSIDLHTFGVTATVTGPRDRDDGPLMIQVFSEAAPVVGRLTSVLRQHAPRGVPLIMGTRRTTDGSAIEVLWIQATVATATPVYPQGSPAQGQPLGTLLAGDVVRLSSGRVYGLQTPNFGAHGPAGLVLVRNLNFDGTLRGVLTGDRDADEGPLTFTVDGRELEVSSAFAKILRAEARNRTVEVKGIVVGDEISVSAVEATAARRLDVYAKGDDIGHDQPIAQLDPGSAVWVLGGSAYVTVELPTGEIGKVQRSGLRFGEAPAAGMIDALNDD